CPGSASVGSLTGSPSNAAVDTSAEPESGRFEMKIAATTTTAAMIAPIVRNPPNESIVSRHCGFGLRPEDVVRGAPLGADGDGGAAGRSLALCLRVGRRRCLGTMPPAAIVRR